LGKFIDLNLPLLVILLLTATHSPLKEELYRELKDVEKIMTKSKDLL
jgi:hypothetical protein